MPYGDAQVYWTIPRTGGQIVFGNDGRQAGAASEKVKDQQPGQLAAGSATIDGVAPVNTRMSKQTQNSRDPGQSQSLATRSHMSQFRKPLPLPMQNMTAGDPDEAVRVEIEDNNAVQVRQTQKRRFTGQVQSFSTLNQVPRLSQQLSAHNVTADDPDEAVHVNIVDEDAILVRHTQLDRRRDLSTNKDPYITLQRTTRQLYTHAPEAGIEQRENLLRGKQEKPRLAKNRCLETSLGNRVERAKDQLKDYCCQQRSLLFWW